MKYNSYGLMSAISLLFLQIYAQEADAQTYNTNLPAPYEEPGGNSVRSADAIFGEEVIDPFTGGLKIVTTDLIVPSNGGLDLKVVRSYQSFQKVTGVLNQPLRDYQLGRTATGIGWDLHFGRLWIGPGLAAPQLGATNATNGCRAINVTSKDNPVLELPDGSRHLFAASDSAETGYAYISSDRWILRCLPTAQDIHSNGGAIAVSPEGIKYTLNFFHRVSNQPLGTPYYQSNSNYAFHVTKIEHPNGTSITVNYVAKASSYYTSISTVTHSEGQSITFSYDNVSSMSAAHLRSFTQAGRTWTFNYTGATNPSDSEYLQSVIRPDGRQTVYEYNVKTSSTSAPQDGVFSLRKITTPLNGTVDYFYVQKTFPTRDVQNVEPHYVVSKKEVRRLTGAVDTWTYNYRPSTATTQQSDFTDVSGPTNCVTYEHYVGQASGTAWKLGVLSSKSVSAPNSSSSTVTCSASYVRRETNSWLGFLIASQDRFRSPNIVSDPQTNAPRLSQVAIIQNGSTYATQFNTPDAYGNAQQIVETGSTTSSNGSSSSISRTTNYTYFTDASAWIIHRLKDETVVSAGPTYATPASSPAMSNYVVGRTFYTSGSKLGLVQAETRAGVTTTFDYNTTSTNGGTLSTATDANSYVTTYSSYKRSVPQTVSRAIDASNTKTINRSINDSGTTAWEQDGEGKQTSYAYNGINQLSGVTTARTDDNDVVITRSTGNTSDIITRSTYKEERLYDGFGTLVQTNWFDTSISASTPRIFQKTDYDAESRPIRHYLPNLSGAAQTNYQSIQYDALNRPTVVTQPDGTTIRYNYLGSNQTCVTDERGFQTLYYYRSFGDPSKQELVRIRADAGATPNPNLNTCIGSGTHQVTYIDRNLIGQTLSIQQEGVTRTFKYNSKFFLFEEDHPELGAVVYTHDNVGNVLSRRVGSSGLTTFVLDRLYRTDFVNYPDGLNVDFDYYKNDRLKVATKGNTRWDYLYDLNNNLKQEKLALTAPTFTSARTYQFDYTYDGRDAEQTLSYPSGLKLDYMPDIFGRPSRVNATQGGTVIAGFASNVIYFPNGQINSIALPNGLTTSYGQDGRLRLSTFVTSGTINGSAQQLVNRLYQYDGANNVSSITDYKSGSNTKTMGYDGLGRLVTANGSWGAGSVSYYSNNNIWTKSFGSDSLTFNYDPSNRLASVSGTTPLSFAYDVYGNMTSTGRATFGNFQFDDDSLLRWVKNLNGTNKIEYAYDGNRHAALERYVDNWSVKYKAHGVSGALLFEEDVSNFISKDYIYVKDQLIATRSLCTGTQDSDGDGIRDCVEFRNGLNKSSAADAGLDADNDGLSNLVEMQAATNIYSADTDADGLTDGYEWARGLNALVSDSSIDSDGDGLTNLQEAQLGTNPLKTDTDGDGIPDNQDPKPLFNPALIPIIQFLLQ